MEEERRAVVGRGESSGVRTSIEGWGVTMKEESGTCVPRATCGLRQAACGVGDFFGGGVGVSNICEYVKPRSVHSPNALIIALPLVLM